MTQKMLRKQCSNTSKEFRTIRVKREKDKRTYIASKAGSEISLKMKVPPSKFAQKIRDVFFMIFKRK